MPSNGRPSQLFRPRGTISVNVAVAISRIPIALLSCRVTKAVFPSGEMLMYSGSRSLATVIPSNRRTPSAFNSANLSLNAANDAVLTVAAATPWPRSMMLTEPSGLLNKLPISPSLATKTVLPSALKVSMSGLAPTVTLPSVDVRSPSASRK